MARIIDVVEFLDETGQEIVHREPETGPGDFRLGSQVIVRQSQVAVFFRDGQALDVLPPGRHTLNTNNIPILANFYGLVTNGRTPFPAEVVFVNMKQFIDQRWGTPEPLPFRDPTFGMARLRAFGAYAFQVKEPATVVNQIAGQQGIFNTSELQDFFRGILVQRFTDTLGGLQQSLLDLPGMYSEIAASMRSRAQDDFAAMGFEILSLYVNAITPTEETARAIDERASIGAIGDMDTYMKFKAARAIGDAATNPSGGGAGAGLGLGAGVGLGASLAGLMGQSFQAQPQQPQTPAASTATIPPQPAGPLTQQQVQQTLDALDQRLANGEISEQVYNRLVQKWEAKLQELGG